MCVVATPGLSRRQRVFAGRVKPAGRPGRLIAARDDRRRALGGEQPRVLGARTRRDRADLGAGRSCDRVDRAERRVGAFLGLTAVGSACSIRPAARVRARVSRGLSGSARVRSSAPSRSAGSCSADGFRRASDGSRASGTARASRPGRSRGRRRRPSSGSCRRAARDWPFGTRPARPVRLRGGSDGRHRLRTR